MKNIPMTDSETNVAELKAENERLKIELSKLQSGTQAVADGVRKKILELKTKVDSLEKENNRLKEDLSATKKSEEESNRLMRQMVAAEENYDYENPDELSLTALG